MGLIGIGCAREQQPAAASTDTAAAATSPVTLASSALVPAAGARADVVVSDVGADPDASRITTHRVSFDAHDALGIDVYDYEKPGHRYESMYGPLYRWVERQVAIATPKVVGSVNHDLLKPWDEFETQASRDQRVQQWLDATKAVYTKNLASKEYEVFGMQVPPEAARYVPEQQAWSLPLPTLPGITSDADDRTPVPEDAIAHLKELHIPLKPYVTLESEWESAGVGTGWHGVKRARVLPANLSISMSDVERARALRERFRKGQAFYYVRFASEIVTEWGEGYNQRPGAKERTLDYVREGLFLQPVAVAIYTTNPVETLAVFGRGAREDLWFLHRSDLGRAAGQSATRTTSTATRAR